MIIDKEYWDNYYIKFHDTQKPSSFAFFVQNYLDRSGDIIELGCGDGRDATFFGMNGFNVIAIDQSAEVIAYNKEKEIKNVTFICDDFTELNGQKFNGNSIRNIYSRFTLHSINKKNLLKTFDWAAGFLPEGGRFLFEARTVNDPLYGSGTPLPDEAFCTTHYRRFLRVPEIMDEIRDRGFNLHYCVEDYISAHFKNDKAVVLRVIASK